jgi:D-alanine--poly(phosphoribitol) ligase subunit 2
MNDTIIRGLEALFVESLHIEAPPLETDLFESGILDSLQLVELLLQLERRFGVRLAIEDMDLDKLRTLDRIAQLIATAGSQTGARAEQARPSEGRREKRVAVRAVR